MWIVTSRWHPALGRTNSLRPNFDLCLVSRPAASAAAYPASLIRLYFVFNCTYSVVPPEDQREPARFAGSYSASAILPRTRSGFREKLDPFPVRPPKHGPLVRHNTLFSRQPPAAPTIRIRTWTSLTRRFHYAVYEVTCLIVTMLMRLPRTADVVESHSCASSLRRVVG